MDKSFTDIIKLKVSFCAHIKSFICFSICKFFPFMVFLILKFSMNNVSIDLLTWILISDSARFQSSHYTCSGDYPCNFRTSDGLLCCDSACRFFCSNWTGGKFGSRSLQDSLSTPYWAWGAAIWVNSGSFGMVLWHTFYYHWYLLVH